MMPGKPNRPTTRGGGMAIYKCVNCGKTSGANYCDKPACGTSQHMIPNPAWERFVGRDWRESMRGRF